MKVVFLVGHISRQAVDEGEAFSRDDLATLEYISEQANIDAELHLVCEDRKTHGYKPSVQQIRDERPRMLAALEAAAPDLIVAFGGVPVTALWDKGGLKSKEFYHKTQRPAGIAAPVAVVQSLEEIAVKPGLRPWIVLDILRALGGETPVQFGEHHVQTEIHPDLAAYLNDASIPDKMVTVDLETFPGTNPWDPGARIRMVIISHRRRWAQVVQCGPASEIPDWVRNLLQDPLVLKGGSNIRFDVRWLRRFGYEVVNYRCTHHDEHLLEENSGIHNLKALSLKYEPSLGEYENGLHKIIKERDVWDAKHKKILESGWGKLKDEEMYLYAGGDGEAGIASMQGQRARIVRDGLQRPAEVSQVIYQAVTELEIQGACVDMKRNAELEDLYAAELARLKAEIRGVLGPINPRSPKQLVPALQAHCHGIDLVDMFKRKKDEDDDPYSTRAFVLRREAARYPLLRLILEFRRRDALYKFVKGMRKYVVNIRGRDYVFSSLRGDIARTYRLSSSKPNLQNLPRTLEDEIEVKLNVKSQYVSRFEGGSILELDHSQVELREAGMIAEDRALIEAFASGEDVHTVLAAMMRGIDISEVTKEIRQNGKTTNFHVLYGGGAYGLSMRLGCALPEAERSIEYFDDTFTGYRKWERRIKKQARTQGYVESRYGYRRRFPAVVDWTSKMGRRALRQAGNAPIQNGAFGHLGLGLAATLVAFKKEGLKSVPYLTVHDSQVIDVFPGEESVAREVAARAMENIDAAKYGVSLNDIPLRVDAKAGVNWGAMEEVNVS